MLERARDLLERRNIGDILLLLFLLGVVLFVLGSFIGSIFGSSRRA